MKVDIEVVDEDTQIREEVKDDTAATAVEIIMAIMCKSMVVFCKHM